MKVGDLIHTKSTKIYFESEGAKGWASIKPGKTGNVLQSLFLGEVDPKDETDSRHPVKILKALGWAPGAAPLLEKVRKLITAGDADTAARDLTKAVELIDAYLKDYQTRTDLHEGDY